ncbi:LCP family protein [Clostridium sp.]|uniref:LCP family protein n=1 Tax=Clostridium sp. TaxID=1506 RepID=UPI003F31BC5C
MSEKDKSEIKEKKYSVKKKILIGAIGVLVVISSIIFISYGYVKERIYTEYTPIKVESEGQFKVVDGITNVLLIGTDARDLDEESRADSMIIATLDNNNKKIKLTSLFRDTLVEIEGYGEQKINSAYEIGGVNLLLDTINTTYNMNIDKYIVVNFSGFEEVINQIGGIEVDVKDYQLEELNKYIGESTGGNDCPVEETGLQVLNGKQALSYSRIRKGVGDDFERVERQREVLTKVTEKIYETNPIKYLGVMNKMLGYIKTNIDPLRALDMAYTISKFPELAIEQIQIPVLELVDDRKHEVLGDILVMDEEQNRDILNSFIFEDKKPNPEEYDYLSFYEALEKYDDVELVYELEE